MKIAILSFYTGQATRGVETWAESLKHNMPNRFDIQIISGRVNESIFLNAMKTSVDWLKADVVVPTNGRFQAIVCRLLTWVAGKPLVIFGHSGLGFDDKLNLLCSPDVFVAFSSYQKKWAERFRLPWTRIILIPHAVDTDLFKPGGVKRRKVVLTVAANTPQKRVHLVREAVGRLAETKFVAVGKGNPIQVDHDKMPEVYRQANVFCLVPQPWDAFGIVFLEALASNLPVVTIDDPIRREIVGEAGIFVKNPGHVAKLAAAIKEALKTKWGNKPRKQAEKFSWDKVAKQYEALFKSLMI